MINKLYNNKLGVLFVIVSLTTIMIYRSMNEVGKKPSTQSSNELENSFYHNNDEATVRVTKKTTKPLAKNISVQKTQKKIDTRFLDLSDVKSPKKVIKKKKITKVKKVKKKKKTNKIASIDDDFNFYPEDNSQKKSKKEGLEKNQSQTIAQISLVDPKENNNNQYNEKDEQDFSYWESRLLPQSSKIDIINLILEVKKNKVNIVVFYQLLDELLNTENNKNIENAVLAASKFSRIESFNFLSTVIFSTDSSLQANILSRTALEKYIGSIHTKILEAKIYSSRDESELILVLKTLEKNIKFQITQHNSKIKQSNETTTYVDSLFYTQLQRIDQAIVNMDARNNKQAESLSKNISSLISSIKSDNLDSVATN